MKEFPPPAEAVELLNSPIDLPNSSIMGGGPPG